MSWRKFLAIPQLVWYGVRAPKDQVRAWDGYWARVERTGPDGHVLWDAASARELEMVLSGARAHLDLTLPVLDVGCGNGRFSRALVEQQRMLPHGWQDHDSYHVLYTPKRMTVQQLLDGQRWAIRETYSYESTQKRLAVSVANGSIDLAKPTFGDQLFRLYATAVLTREAVTQDPEMSRFIRMLLKVMWSRRHVKVLALLMILDRYEFVHRVLEKQAAPQPAA